MEYTKINEFEYKKITPQPDLEEVGTLEELLQAKADYEECLAKVNAEIAEVQKLGLKKTA